MILSSLLFAAPVLAMQLDTYNYNPIGKRDPFASFIQTDSPPEVSADAPLQRFEVAELTVTGIVWGDNPKAMVLAPDNSVHVVQMGTYVGRYWGRVTEITTDSIVVREEWMRLDNELVTREHSLTIKQGGALNLGR